MPRPGNPGQTRDQAGCREKQSSPPVPRMLLHASRSPRPDITLIKNSPPALFQGRKTGIILVSSWTVTVACRCQCTCASPGVLQHFRVTATFDFHLIPIIAYFPGIGKRKRQLFSGGFKCAALMLYGCWKTAMKMTKKVLRKYHKTFEISEASI